MGWKCKSCLSFLCVVIAPHRTFARAFLSPGFQQLCEINVKGSGHQDVSMAILLSLSFLWWLGQKGHAPPRFHASLLADIDNLFRLKNHISFGGQIRVPIGFSAAHDNILRGTCDMAPMTVPRPR